VREGALLLLDAAAGPKRASEDGFDFAPAADAFKRSLLFFAIRTAMRKN